MRIAIGSADTPERYPIDPSGERTILAIECKGCDFRQTKRSPIMRELTLEECELIAGGSTTDEIVVTADSGGGDDWGGDWGDWGDWYDTGGDYGDGGGGGGDVGDAGATSPNIDYGFIERHEGGILTQGYVPPSGHSGVTIGAGVDLGQHTAAELAAWGVPQSLINVLQPYLGLSGATASNYLAGHPLTISLADATTLSHLAENDFTADVASNYNSASGGNFYDLPQGAQTAVVDLAYQYGTNLAGATPNFWSQITTGDWNAAIQNLDNFGDDYDTRRGDEADLLRQEIADGTLQQGDVG
jgi:GH24 family phage-related lysozyme (muramidase)